MNSGRVFNKIRKLKKLLKREANGLVAASLES